MFLCRHCINRESFCGIRVSWGEMIRKKHLKRLLVGGDDKNEAEKHFSGLQMMPLWAKPMNFSNFLSFTAAVNTTYYTLPETLCPFWLSPSWFSSHPQMLFCRIPSWLLPLSQSLAEVALPPQGWFPDPPLAESSPWASEPCGLPRLSTCTRLSLPPKPALHLAVPAPTCPTRNWKPLYRSVPFKATLHSTTIFLPVNKKLQFSEEPTIQISLYLSLKTLQWCLRWLLILAYLLLHYTPPFTYRQHCSPSLGMFPCSSELASWVLFTPWLLMSRDSRLMLPLPHGEGGRARRRPSKHFLGIIAAL